jgi:hypothetical protein
MDAKGLLRSLYDFSFTSLITTKIIRFAYIVTVIMLSLGAAFLFIGSLASGQTAGVVFGIILVPLGYLLYLIMARIWMEFLIVVFRIGEDIHAIRVGGNAPPNAGGSISGGGETPSGPGWPS